MAPNSTHDTDALAARLDAVERAVAADDDRNSPSADIPESAGDGGETAGVRSAADRAKGDERDAEIEALRERVATLEAELDAVRGLLGGVRAVEESVERRADAALAKVERLESSMAEESGLVVERVPVDDLPDGSPAGESDTGPAEKGRERSPRTDEAETNEAETDGGTSLAARLREAL